MRTQPTAGRRQTRHYVTALKGILPKVYSPRRRTAGIYRRVRRPGFNITFPARGRAGAP